MDFIQSAIEKARRERAQRSAEQPGDEVVAASQPSADPSTRPATEPGPPAPEITAAADRAALWSGLPEFSVNLRRLERNRVLAITGGGDAASFDIMRTKLLHQMRSNGWRRLAITSPTAACGKTTLALNLGFSLARQRDIYTMVVEFDMRRPSMLQVLGLQQGSQFAQVLTGDAPAEAHLLRRGANLLLATNTRPTPNAAELLQQVETGRIVDAMEARYAPDIMIFDMPPMLATDDTLAFIDQIDCVLLVAAAGSSTMAEINRCTDELSARCNFLGVILNKCRYLEDGDAYGYGSGGYGY